MISSIVSRLVILVFGTLYPAYASYKAVRTKNVKEYVKWMMYWIVFALFTCAETFTDVFLSFWFPFYYEIKIILVLWLLSPATKGSSILYRKFVHPMLSRREQEIDEYIAKAKEQGYHTVLHLGTKGVNYATTVLMQTAIKGGGGLVNQLRRSYSLSDLSSDKESDMNRNNKALKNVPDEDEMEEETDGLDPRMLRPRGYSPRRSASGSGRVEMYFPEVDVDVRQHGSSRPREPSIPLSHIRSSEDVSSGYSSAEPLYAGHHATKSEGLAASREPLVRTASVGSTRSMRTKSSRGGIVAKRGPAAEDSELMDLQGDEADFYYQEEYYYDKSSSLLSQTSESIPFPGSIVKRSSKPLFTLPVTPFPIIESKMEYIISESDNVTMQEQYIDASDLKSGSLEDDDDDMPLCDAEAESNEHHLAESLLPLVKQDVNTISDLETATSKDPIISNSSTEMSNACLSSGESLSTNDYATSSLSEGTVDQVSDLTISAVEKTEIFQENNEELVANEISVHDQNLLSQQAVLQPKNEENNTLIHDKVDMHKDLVISDSLKQVEPSTLLQQTDAASGISTTLELFPENASCVTNEALNIKGPPNIINQTHTASQLNGQAVEKLNEDCSTLEPSFADETISNTEVAVATSPLTVTSAESLLQDNTMDISSESQDSNYDSGGELLNGNDLELTDTKSSLVPMHEVNVSNEQVTETVEDILEVKNLNDSSVISYSIGDCSQISLEDTVAKPLGDDSSSACASVESLSLPESLSRSGSQCSMRKEGRSGKYHKRPAPTPPPRNTDSENENYTDIGDKINQEPMKSDDVIKTALTDLEKNEHTEDMGTGSEDESAVTARLILKPGVVRSLGPDSSTKTEVFVSKTPHAKIKRSKSKNKQGDSSFSRFFALPKNQFGGLSSLIPFWPGKQEVSPSAQSGVSGNTQITEHKNLHDTTNVTKLSHSPGQQRRAPLADYTKSGY